MPPILSPISPTLPPMEMWTVWYSEWASYWRPLISSLSTQYLQLTPPWDSLSLAPVIKLSQSANLGCKDEQQFFGNNIYFTLIMCLLRMLYRWFVHPIIIWSWGGGMMSRTRSSRFSTCINISWDRLKMPATTTHYIFSDFRLDPTKFEFKTVRVWARRREVFALICYSAASWWLAVLRTKDLRTISDKIGRILISISWPTLHFGLGSWTHPRDCRDIAITILQDALAKGRGDAETVTMWRSDRRELARINQNYPGLARKYPGFAKSSQD